MSITLDFILLFVFFIIPGLIFKRFYFYGEFSKQFTTKDTVYQSIFYGIIPGIAIQFLGMFIYISFFETQFTNHDVLEVLKDFLTLKEEHKSEKTPTFLNSGIQTFLVFESFVFVLALILGLLSSRLVRLCKLDIRFKPFRYRNTWYYIFSGEINSFKKFKKTRKHVDPFETEDGSFKYYPPYVDVLINSGNGLTLYSGYLIDYDLNYEKPGELEKIYLLHANRYRVKESETVNDPKINGSKTKVSIPGDTFILNCKGLVNVNIKYIAVERDKSIKSKKLETLVNIGLLFNFLVFIYFWSIKLPFIKDISENLYNYLEPFNFWSRTYAAFVISQFVSIFTPSSVTDTKTHTDSSDENDDHDESIKQDPIIGYEYKWRNMALRFAVLAVLVIIYWLIYY